VSIVRILDLRFCSRICSLGLGFLLSWESVLRIYSVWVVVPRSISAVFRLTTQFLRWELFFSAVQSLRKGLSFQSFSLLIIASTRWSPPAVFPSEWSRAAGASAQSAGWIGSCCEVHDLHLLRSLFAQCVSVGFRAGARIPTSANYLVHSLFAIWFSLKDFWTQSTVGCSFWTGVELVGPGDWVSTPVLDLRAQGSTFLVRS
jgi:hypothetical protein